MGDEDLVVDFGTVVLCAADDVFAFDSVDDDVIGLPHAGEVLLQGYLFLDFHEFGNAAFFFFGADVVGELVGRGALFGGVGETAHAVETGLADKVFQFLEFLESFAGVADDEGGADGYVGQLMAEVLQEAESALAVDAALHGVEYTGVDVLQGDVDVVADVGVAADDVDGVEREGGRIGVVETYPGGTALGGQSVEEGTEHALTIEVEAIVGGVLCYDDDFLHPLGDHLLCLVEDVLDGTGNVFPANERYGAIGAGAVAPFADFQVSVVFGSGLHAFGFENVVVFRLKRADKFAPLVDSVEGIDFGQFFTQLLLVALNETSDGDETARFAAALLDGNLLEEDVDRLLFGVADKAASIDNDDVAVVAASVKEEIESRFAQVAGDMLRVDDVLATSEGYDVDFH